jgi:tripartite-type tricarboxylate transporter receptor subunit TctC
VSSAKRTLLMPEVPTVAESGVPGFEVLGWFALLAPAGTPPAVVSLLNAEVNKMIVKPAYVQRFAGLGAEPLPSAPAETAAFIRAEQDKWGRIIKDVGIKAE